MAHVRRIQAVCAGGVEVIELTEIAATIKLPLPVLVCKHCGTWFSICLWGQNSDGEPKEVPLIQPKFCPVCGVNNYEADQI